MKASKTLFRITTDKSCLNIDIIHEYLSNRSYWAKGRSRDIVKRSIENSLCFAVCHEDNQVGFARVVTDYAVFAWILDVFILEEYRGNGLGKMLMGNIMEHEQLRTIRRWGLGTDDAHGLYAKFGFTALSKPENMMEKISQRMFY